MPWLPVLFLVLPFTELMILLKVGAEIGTLNTLGIVILTAMTGYALFKHQGLRTWQSVEKRLSEGEMPSKELLEGVVILLAGALMITPGLITDIAGLICLIPMTRQWVLKGLSRVFNRRIVIMSSFQHRNGHSEPDQNEPGRTIDGECQQDDHKNP